MITVETDLQKKIDAFIASTDAKQVRFAANKAINLTAEQVQAEVRKNMPSKFTLRRQWIVGGIRVRYSKINTLTAQVYSKDEFMARQEYGDPKTPKFDQHLAIPMRAVRRTKSDIIKTVDLPSSLGKAEVTKKMRGGKNMVIRGAGGSVFKTTINGKLYLCRRRPGKDMEILYLLIPKAQIKKRLGLVEDGAKIVKQNLAQNFATMLERAIATARA